MPPSPPADRRWSGHVAATAPEDRLAGPAARAETDTRILDAAGEQVMAVGVRRTTLTDVAARAGVSRMTVYRRYPDVTTLVQSLMTREFTAIIERAATDAREAPNVRERIAQIAVGGAQRLATHPLWLRIVDVDPELALPYVTQRTGAFQHHAIDALAAQLAAADDGSVRAGEPDRVAAAIELALRGFALAARDESIVGRRPELADELRRMISAYLAP